MKIAARDGDLRAMQYVASFEYSERLKVSQATLSLNKSGLSLHRSDNAIVDVAGKVVASVFNLEKMD